MTHHKTTQQKYLTWTINKGQVFLDPPAWHLHRKQNMQWAVGFWKMKHKYEPTCSSHCHWSCWHQRHAAAECGPSFGEVTRGDYLNTLSIQHWRRVFIEWFFREEKNQRMEYKRGGTLRILSWLPPWLGWSPVCQGHSHLPSFNKTNINQNSNSIVIFFTFYTNVNA